MVDFLSYLTSFQILVPLGLVSLPLLVLLAVMLQTFVTSPAEAEEHGGAALEAPPEPSTAPPTGLPTEAA